MEEIMKRLVNNPDNIVEEMLEGYTRAFNDKIKLADSDPRVVIKKNIDKEKVGVIIGGGSGHEPMFMGYVGEGFATGAVIGDINTSPDPFVVFNSIKEVGSKVGTLLIYGNYSGDVMNFDMAQDMAREEGYIVESLQVTDDVASSEEKDKRRGIAGDFFVMKVAGTAAHKGLAFEDVIRVSKKANANTASMGVALGAAEDPRTGKAMFEIDDSEMEIGMGIHGELGIRRGKKEPLDDVVDEIIEPCIDDLGLKENDEVALLINGLGATPYMDLFVMSRRASQVLDDKKIKIEKTFVGNYANTMNMPGQSVTLIKLDDELKELIEYPTDAPYFIQK